MAFHVVHLHETKPILVLQMVTNRVAQFMFFSLKCLNARQEICNNDNGVTANCALVKAKDGHISSVSKSVITVVLRMIYRRGYN